MSKKKIIMFLDNSYAPDSRVENEINALLDKGYEVDLYCVGNNAKPDFEDLNELKIYREISKELHRPFSKEYRQFTEVFTTKIAEYAPWVIHCHDFRMYFLGVEVKKKYPQVKLVYDSHEYLLGYPYFYRIRNLTSKFKGMFVWMYYVLSEVRSLKKADAIITVSETLKRKLERRSHRPTFLVRNIPPNSNRCVESCHYWHKKFNLPLKVKVFVHTGNAYFSIRRRDLLFEVMKGMEDLALVFLGSNNSINEMKSIVENQNINNILFHPQIPRKEVTYYCSQANFGLVYTWNPFWRSYWYAMPNKLMDVSLAGIPVLATAQPEIKHFIQKHGNGVLFKGWTKRALKNAIAEIVNKESEIKNNSLNLIQEVTWNNEKEVLYRVYQSLT